MAEAEKKQSFWTTMPGILTGVAALLTAATGLWVAIAPHDKSATEGRAASVSPPMQSSAPGSAPPASTQQNPAVSSVAAGPVATARDTVTVTSRAGDVTKLSAKTFVHNSTDKAIELTSGQTIAFEKIKAIDFLSVHPEARSVDVKLTLVDGKTITGAVTKDYAFTGENDLGSFRIFVQDVKQIVFG